MQRRQPAGVPIGGEFAANEHDEATGALKDGRSRLENRLGSTSSIPGSDMVVPEDQDVTISEADDVSRRAFPGDAVLAQRAHDDIVDAGDDLARISDLRDRSEAEIAQALREGDRNRAQSYVLISDWALSKINTMMSEEPAVPLRTATDHADSPRPSWMSRLQGEDR